VSVVKYLNTAPLVWGLERGPLKGRYRLSYTVPAECAEALRHGTADVGIIPSIEYQTIRGLKIVPGIAIASERKVESVLLVSRGPARRAKRVALDASSRTSAALVKILFARLWKREPAYTEAAPDLKAMLSANDAALLIGDPALQFALKSPAALSSSPAAPLSRAESRDAAGDLHVYDLAEEWVKLTNLPFVFAFWAARAEVARAMGNRVAHDLHTSRDEGMKHIGEIAREAAGRLKLPGGQVERYLRVSIQYRLDAPHRAGLESFFRFAAEQGLIEKARPLEFL